MNKGLLIFFVTLIATTLIYGASISCCEAKRIVIAVVNGEAIDEDYLLEIIRDIHMDKSRSFPRGEAAGIDIKEIIENLINERLITQEAVRLGFDQTPEVIQGVQNFLEINSIIKMRQEVLDKVEVSREEIREHFSSTYTGDENELEASLEALKDRISRSIRKEKESRLKFEFLENLRQLADIQVDWELIQEFNPGQPYSGDKQRVATVNGEPIFLEEFTSDLLALAHSRQPFIKEQDGQEQWLEELKESVLNRLIGLELIRQEALRQNYLSEADFARVIQKRKHALLRDMFKQRIILPLSQPTEEEKKQYYLEHPDKFRSNYQAWFSEMVFKDRQKAEQVLDELRQGADFEYLATQVTLMGTARRYVWVNSNNLPQEIRSALDQMQEGEISEVVQSGRNHVILKLRGKRGKEVLEYSKVAGSIEEMVRKEKFEKVIDEYVHRLREMSDIVIQARAVETINKRIWQ